MRARFFIRITDIGGGADAGIDSSRASWASVDEHGAVASIGHGPLSEISRGNPSAQVIVVIPGTRVLLTAASLPSRNRQRVISALPYALEDGLASDVEKLHFATGNWGDDGKLASAVIDRQWLKHCLSELQQAGINADVVVSETLALPYQEGQWTVLPDGPMTSIRTGPQSGVTVDSANLESVLKLMLAEAGEHQPAQLRVVSCLSNVESSPPQLPGLPDGIELSHEQTSDDCFTVLIRNYDETHAINLLQGPYSRKEQIGKLWRPWLPAIAMLVVLMVIYAGNVVWDYSQLSARSERLTEEVNTLYKTAFPDAKRIVNPKAQMTQALKELRQSSPQGGGVNVLGLLAKAGPVLKKTSGLELKRLSYKEGIIDIALIIDNIQKLDVLRDDLEKDATLKTEIISATARDNGETDVRMQIKAGEV